MKISLNDLTFLTILLVAVILFAVVLIAIAVYLVLKSRKKTGEAKPEESKPGKLRRFFPPAVPGMAESFRQAKRRLREKLPSWNARYDAPWYALVGVAGSGKTTVVDAITGLTTEVVASYPADYAPRWLLLDKAVLIDVPGKSFLTAEPETPTVPPKLPAMPEPDSVRARARLDRIAWQSFLRLTARYRPRQPLNGIVLTIPATELLEADSNPDDPRRVARIADISQRLDEVQRLLSLSLPVYVLVTKCDQVTGFSGYSRCFFEQSLARRAATNGAKTEICDDLFGWSNPHVLDSSYNPDWTNEAFDSVNEILLQRQLEMLAETKTPTAADSVFTFPFELQRLRMPLELLLDRVFRATTYHSSHLLRGIYFCGRESAEDPAPPDAAAPPATKTISPGIFEKPSNPVLYVQDLFEAKVFPERYLATPVAHTFFSRNRSVLIAQISACALIVLLGVGSIHAWNRIGRLQETRINPVLQSLSASLEGIAVSSGANVTPAVDVFNTLGAAHENEYYSWALPYSYVDLEGLHAELHETLEETFENVLLRSCKDTLESRISAVLSSSPVATPVTSQPASDYPSGFAWSGDPAYRELAWYLSDLKALHTNMDRYRLISSAGSGSFKQLNELLHYLGGRDLPDSGRFAQDANYQKMLLDATFQPLTIKPNYDDLTGAATRQRIAAFYQSWFDSNPLIGEVKTLAGKDGLQGLYLAGGTTSNQQLRAIVSQAQSIDNQLKGGTYDWLAESFNRDRYPALGSELDEMPFANSQFVDWVATQGTQKLAGLNASLQTSPAIIAIQDGKARLDGDVRTVASVLDALLGYELMADTYESPVGCKAMPADPIWNPGDLNKAVELDGMRDKIESELLPGLPGEYHDVVQRLVRRRAATALSTILQTAAEPNPNAGDKQAALQTELESLNQSVDKLKQISDSLVGLHATAEETCLAKSLTQQANSLLVRINQQLPALYGPVAPPGQEDKGLPVSQWMYGVTSADDLQAYLATERQQIETWAAEAAPVVQLLRTAGGHSGPLNRWSNISQDVESLQAKKPNNPIQNLESFITNDLDKITPAAACKSPAIQHKNDVFLNVRADLSKAAVNYCYSVAVFRFNEIAADFNQKLAGQFPFSQLADTRSGSEAVPKEIAKFYNLVDQDNPTPADPNSPGLAGALAMSAENPDDAKAFLQAIADVRLLVSGTAKDPTPSLGISAHFRTNRNREVFGNRIAEWYLQVGQKSLSSPPDPGDAPALIWRFGDPIALAVRYANNSPETPATSNPSAAARVQGKTVTYQYSDPWSLFAMLRDHPPASTGPGNQYALIIPNAPSSGASGAPAPVDTVVYIQIDLLPIGAKPGGDTLPVPAFPYKAPLAALKSAHGE